MESQSIKENLRAELQKARLELSEERRREASQTLFSRLADQLSSYMSVLSFYSKEDEIDTSLLNFFLARTGRLVLPRIEGDSLGLFKVSNLETDLIPGPYNLMEPNPNLCEKLFPTDLDVVLVPAIAFDSRNHRIGYGKGYYDRFLSQIPHTLSIGIGFSEQLIPFIPIDEFDFPLKELRLF